MRLNGGSASKSVLFFEEDTALILAPTLGSQQLSTFNSSFF